MGSSGQVESAEIKVMGPSEDVWRRLSLPGAVVAWLFAGSWDEGDRVGRANLARFQVGRCLGIASCRVPRIAGRFMACVASSAIPVRRARRWAARCLGRVEQALVVSHERGQ